MFASCPDGVETVAAMAPDAVWAALQRGEQLRALSVPVVGGAELAARPDVRPGAVVFGVEPVGAHVGDAAGDEAPRQVRPRARQLPRVAQRVHEGHGGRAVLRLCEIEVLLER